jgi:hypothetical protein
MMNKTTDTGNKQWYIWLSLGTIVIAFIVFITGKNLPELLGTSQSSAALAAEQVRACMQQHGLSEAHAVLQNRSTPDPNSGETTIFAECNWPPPSYSAPDGYSEIKVITISGPGLSEAEGATDVDRFLPPCDQIKISYSFAHQNFEQLPPFVAKGGSIVMPEGNPWPGDRLSLNIIFERREVDVVRNLSYILDEVECVP